MKTQALDERRRLQATRSQPSTAEQDHAERAEAASPAAEDQQGQGLLRRAHGRD